MKGVIIKHLLDDLIIRDIMKDLVKAIQNRIDQLNFEQLWPGFHVFPFALYNDAIAIIDGEEVAKPDDFLGNTAIEYHHQVIAIWKIDDHNAEIDLTILTSKIIHEMFHAFQQEKNEQRFPNELKALQYTYDCVNLSMKYLEGAKIQKLHKQFSEKMLNELLMSIDYRRKQYPFEYAYESKIETVEGMAQFVELLALKQLDIDRYRKKIYKMLSYIQTIDHYQGIRFLSYDFGTLLMLFIKDNSLHFDYDLGCKKTIADQLLEMSHEGKSNPYCKVEFKNLISNIYKVRSQIVNDILENPHDTKDLNHSLYGFDPLNTFFHEQYIYCKDFAGIKDNQLTWLRGEMLFEVNKEDQLIKLYTKKISSN